MTGRTTGVVLVRSRPTLLEGRVADAEGDGSSSDGWVDAAIGAEATAGLAEGVVAGDDAGLGLAEGGLAAGDEHERT